MTIDAQKLRESVSGNVITGRGKKFREMILSIADHIDAQAEEIAEYKRILSGLPQETIDGGWTAAGMSDYAKSLEDRMARLRKVLEDLVRDHGDPMDSATTNYFWEQARAALSGESND